MEKLHHPHGSIPDNPLLAEPEFSLTDGLDNVVKNVPYVPMFICICLVMTVAKAGLRISLRGLMIHDKIILN